MTDAELVTKKLGDIATYLRELELLGRPDRIEEDLRDQRFLLHTLQMAIQAALDAASHIVTDERLGEPEANRELFLILGSHGWLPSDLAHRLAEMASFRNVIVHGYSRVDLGIVRRIAEEDLDDLQAFIRAIRPRLE